MRAQAADQAARAETSRVRADAERMLSDFRAEAARARDELRADLRARAERAEREADAYRDELAQLRSELTQLRVIQDPGITGRWGVTAQPAISPSARTQNKPRQPPMGYPG